MLMEFNLKRMIRPKLQDESCKKGKENCNETPLNRFTTVGERTSREELKTQEKKREKSRSDVGEQVT